MIRGLEGKDGGRMGKGTKRMGTEIGTEMGWKGNGRLLIRRGIFHFFHYSVMCGWVGGHTHFEYICFSFYNV